MADDELVDRLLIELGWVLGIDVEPDEVRITRWPRSFPQYAVGHLDRVAEIEGALGADAPGLFGVGIGADVMMILLDVTVAIGLFRLLRSVDRRLALSAMVLRLIQGAVIGVNLLNLVGALGSAQDATAGATVLAGPARDALDAVERHALGYDVGLIAFGLSCLVLGRLLRTSGSAPRWIAVGMSVTGVVYLVGSAAALLAPGLSAVIDPFYLIAFVVELAFAVRLVRHGLPTAATPNLAQRPIPAAA